MLFDSVAPAVNTISFGCTPKKRAMVMRASSSAFEARRPCSCVSDDGLPNVCVKNGSMASTTRGSHGVVAWWSR